MLRKDREITDRNAIIDIIRKSHVCHLAFNDASTGYPYIVPMNFGIVEDGDNLTLAFHCAKRGHKLDCLKADARVTFEMEYDVQLVYNPAHGHNTDIFKSVIGRGIAEIVEDPQEKGKLLQAMMDHYHNPPITVTDVDIARCTIFKVTVTELWGKEKKLKNR